MGGFSDNYEGSYWDQIDPRDRKISRLHQAKTPMFAPYTLKQEGNSLRLYLPCNPHDEVQLKNFTLLYDGCSVDLCWHVQDHDLIISHEHTPLLCIALKAMPLQKFLQSQCKYITAHWDGDRFYLLKHLDETLF